MPGPTVLSPAGALGAATRKPVTARAGAERLAGAVAALAQESADARTIELLHGAGIWPVLLKGPVTARRLYPGEVRARLDCDLLVDPALFDAARAVLTAAGYGRHDPCGHAQLLLDARGHAVDLHWTLSVVTASPERVWAVLARHTEPFPLGATVVAALDEPAHACHLALHAVSSATSGEAAWRDLDRAVARFPLATWRAALTVAEDLGAGPAAGAALRAGSASCRALADDLGLPARVPFAQRLRLADTSLFLEARHTLRAVPAQRRRALLRNWLLPTRAEITRWAARPDIQAATPAGLSPVARLLWYRGRQFGRFASAVGQAARRG